MGIAFEMWFLPVYQTSLPNRLYHSSSAQGIARETSNKTQGIPIVTWMTTNMTKRGLIKYVKESTFKYVWWGLPKKKKKKKKGTSYEHFIEYVKCNRWVCDDYSRMELEKWVWNISTVNYLNAEKLCSFTPSDWFGMVALLSLLLLDSNPAAILTLLFMHPLVYIYIYIYKEKF